MKRKMPVHSNDQKSDSRPSLNNLKQYQQFLKFLTNPGDSGNSLILKMMQIFEDYRSRRKIGWSRPQNKYGIITFQSAYLPSHVAPEEITTLIFSGKKLSSSHKEYCANLLTDSQNISLMFLQNKLYPEKSETVTFSFGKIVPGKSRHRHRLDLVMDFVLDTENIQSGTLHRISIYIDPFTEPVCIKTSPDYEWSGESGSDRETIQLAEQLVFKYLSGLNSGQLKLWEHWSHQYVKYFGTREFFPENSIFERTTRYKPAA